MDTDTLRRKIWWKAELRASMCEIHQGLSPGKRHQLSACIHDHVIIINISIRGKYMPQNEHGKHGKQKGKIYQKTRSIAKMVLT